MNTCECSDPGCPVHKGKETCERPAVLTVYRVDMEDETGTDMCTDCAADALESGVFATRESEDS